MKTLALFDTKTGESRGYVQLSNDSDVSLYDPASSLEIPNEHPAIHDQRNWQIKDGRLVSRATGQPYVAK